jgi:ribonuclease BN (tRNA processing enzyme)
MKLTVLGCSGGIGGGRHTTSFLLDDDILIDAGSGVTTLELEQMKAIDHVVITHSHLDHVLGLPLLLDTVGDARAAPVVVHALPAVLEILAADLFNWRLWPDFREIPSAAAPWLRFAPMRIGEALTLGARRIVPLPVQHVVPACGVALRGPGGSLAFSGDTTACPALIAALNALPDLRHLVIETSFENAHADIARDSQHHWPDSLAVELAQLAAQPDIWITHLKPGNETAIMAELHAAAPWRAMQALRQGQILVW